MPTSSSSEARRRWPWFSRIAAVHSVAKWSAVRRANARVYNLLFAAVVFPPVLVMLALALLQEPLRGDLTRTGGYSEHRFGWNQPQQRFVPPLAALRYDRPYDIVVLGDSFSSNPRGTGQTDSGAFWTNFLAQRTGLSVVVLNMFEITFAELLAHPIFVNSPPRLFVLATVERYLTRDHADAVDQFMGQLDRTCAEAGPAPAPLPAFRPLASQPVPWVRDTAPRVDLDQAANYLWKFVRRDVFGIEATSTRRLPLTRDDLFSSRASDILLVYDDELRKPAWTTPPALATAHCNLIDAQRRVQANGRTRFVYMPVPDKMTAYAEYLANPELRDTTLLPAFYQRAGLSQVRLLDALREAIRCGRKDVYMPNDTHWSTAAHSIVADVVVATVGGGQRHPAC
jgi:hypothetical protein